MRFTQSKTTIKRILLVVFTLLFLFLGFKASWLALGMYRWNTFHWAPAFLLNGPSSETVPDSEKHLIFVMVDHYEHGSKPDAAERNKIWCDKFQSISDRQKDDFGNKFRYTWFYPFDHHVEEIVAHLSKMAYEGYGEIEFHWHIGANSGITKDNFAEKLTEAIRWFQQFGAMITEEEKPRTAFAYVAGVWDLDASRKPKSHGITNQIEVLRQHGCFADFTFSTIATAAQPRKINSIYYVKDDFDKPKSHNNGTDVTVGKSINQSINQSVDQLMIFQGPMTIDWNGSLEYGAVENDPRFSPKRISKWMHANIHVSGRPEWVFVKVYSHGAQSKNVVLAEDMEKMLTSLKEYCLERDIKLHFMTAREAFNVVKAAEAGKTGNPEDFRDFYIPKYQNMVRPFPVEEGVINDGNIAMPQDAL